MTTEHWLTIIAIIATSITTLAAPILAEFVKSRMSQPSPSPDPSQPKKLIQRIGGWLKRAVLSPWWSLWSVFWLLANIRVLLWELHRMTGPIKRDDVLALSITMGAIYYCLMSININFLTGGSKSQSDLSLKFIAIVESLQEQLKTMRQLADMREKTNALANSQIVQPVHPLKPEKPVPDNADTVTPKNLLGS
jgi:hypothetical protein